MDTNDEPTCGKGLAAHAGLPARLGQWAAAMAEMMAFHGTSLDASEELEAYGRLESEFRGIADRLRETAQRMESYRTLPMTAHDEAKLSGAEALDVYAKLVQAEREAVQELQKFLAQDEEMLEQWRGGMA